MILIDTSAWIEFIRIKGNAAVGRTVRNLLLANQAAWCDIIRLELWNGAKSDQDKKLLKGLEIDVIHLETTNEVWDESIELAKKARSKGLTVPSTDVLIAACARHYKVKIETLDNHFPMLDKLR